MKTKTWFWISAILAFPCFLTGLTCLLQLFILRFNPIEDERFWKGQWNNGWFLAFCIITLVGFAVSAITHIKVSYYADKMDVLDEEIQKYREARVDWNTKADKLAIAISNQDARSLTFTSDVQ